jgi:hypothetical protein
MGNFLLAITKEVAADPHSESFEKGLVLLEKDLGHKPESIIRTSPAFCAVCRRENGTGSPIIYDRSTGSWLAAIGTWLHSDGYGSGSEKRLLNRYLESNHAILASELEGFFVIIIFDARVMATLIITDLVGSCHAYQREVRDSLVFCGSSLVLASLDKPDLDPIGCQEFLGTGVIYEDRTLHKSVRKLAAASIYRFSRCGKQTIERYWQFPREERNLHDPRVASGALWETLCSSASRVGKLFSKPVCDLTGGYDSRVLVAACLGAKLPISTVVSGPTGSPDVEISHGLAQALVLPHRHVERSEEASHEEFNDAVQLTDGEFDSLQYVRVQQIHRELARSFDISLNGSFGELARGYWWELLVPHTGTRRLLNSRRLSVRRYVTGGVRVELFPAKTRINLADHMRGVIERNNVPVRDLANTAQMDNAYLMLRMQRWQGRIATSTNRIWPCFSLFMCRSILDTILSLPPRLRKRSFLVRRMLVDFQPRLARYPLEHGYPAEPMTPQNVLRFAPLVSSYARRVTSRLLRSGPLPWSGRSLAPVASPRWRLPQYHEYRQLLNVDTMQLSEFLDPSALRAFLEQPTYVDEPFWSRLFTLESALRWINPRA